MKRARIQFSREALEGMLSFPESLHIKHLLQTQDDILHDTFSITVEGDALGEEYITPEGCEHKLTDLSELGILI